MWTVIMLLEGTVGGEAYMTLHVSHVTAPCPECAVHEAYQTLSPEMPTVVDLIVYRGAQEEALGHLSSIVRMDINERT